MTQIKGVWVPLVTPMYRGRFDHQSMIKLLKATQPYIDGYVVGLSSGEGEDLSEGLWRDTLACVASATHKPVAAAILGRSSDGIVSLAATAEQLRCAALVIPATGEGEDGAVDFFSELGKRVSLPLVIYNTEKNAIRSAKTVERLDELDDIIAIKDSSGDDRFFSRMLKMKPELRMSVLQGVENKLLQSKGCDGYMISLSNVEPALCRSMLDSPSISLNNDVLRKFHEYNLGGQWYVTLKALLYGRGVLRSAEQVKLENSPRKVLFDSSIHVGQFHIRNEGTRVACKNSQVHISSKPQAEIVGVVSFNENSWTDDVIWALDRETQDRFYKFMDVFHTVKNIDRVPLSADDAKLALELSESFELDISNALTCALAISRDAHEIHTCYESLLKPEFVRHFDDIYNVDIVKVTAAAENTYAEDDLERHYQDALAAFRQKNINLIDMLHK